MASSAACSNPVAPFTPYQQREAPTLRQMDGDLPRPYRRDRVVPAIDRIQIIALNVARWQVEFHDPAGVGQHVGADRPAQVDQIGFGGALARQQDQVGGAHRGLCGAGQVIGIAGADADQRKVYRPAVVHRAATMWKKVPVTVPRCDPVSITAAPVASMTCANGASGWAITVE